MPTASFTFDFKGRAMRTVVKDGETWFVAADVCALLEIANPRDATSRLDDDEKGVAITDTLGGNQGMNVVNESGLYALIFTSRKPEARAFRRWVTGEVLPAIRKTGQYGAPAGNASRGRTDDGRVDVALPAFGRFIVTTRGSDAAHIHQTDYGTIVQEMAATDFEIMCHALLMVEGFHHKVQHLRSAKIDPEGGFALTGLEETILQGGRLAKHYLRCRWERPG